EAELLGFQPRGRQDHPEQRGWERYPCAAGAVYQLVRSAQPSGRQPATVLNVSGGGVALQVNEALNVGDLLSVELRRDDRAVLTALARVVRTTVLPGGERLVGCNFIDELPEEQITSLLA